MGLLHHIKSEKDRINMEFDFLLVMGISYVMALGYPHRKVKETFNRAIDLAQSMEVNMKLSVPLFNLLSYYFNTEDFKAGNEVVDYMRELAKKDPENEYFFNSPVLLISGAINVIQGDFKRAELYLRKTIEIYDPSQTEFDRSLNLSFKVNGEAWLSVALQVLGKMDEAKTISENHLKIVKDYTGSHYLYHLYTFPALRALLARDWKYAISVMDEYLPIVKKFGDPVFTLTAEVYYNIALAFEGDEKAFETAVQLINVCFDIGFRAFASTLSPFIPEIYFQNGDNQSALNWIDRILNHVNQPGSHGRTAELYRIKGLVMGTEGKSDDIVEEYLVKAMDLARKQSAKIYEVRTASDLALLRQKQGKAREGYDLLKITYDEFTEGHNFPDLKNARKILEELKK
jgi:tetratricopeptide (TPR) repeat protein